MVFKLNYLQFTIDLLFLCTSTGQQTIERAKTKIKNGKTQNDTNLNTLTGNAGQKEVRAWTTATNLRFFITFFFEARIDASTTDDGDEIRTDKTRLSVKICRPAELRARASHDSSCF